MIIISKFKDYYDFIIDKYGRDEKIILDRRIILNNVINIDVRENIKFRFLKPNILPPYKNYDKQICFKFLVICGKIYIVKGLFHKTQETNIQWDTFSLMTFEDLEDKKIMKEFINLIVFEDFGYFEKIKLIKNNYKNHEKFKRFFNNEEYNYMIEISKKINRPIFMIDFFNINQNTLTVYFKVPILEKIKGISGILPPDKIYQDLSYFIGNVLTDQKEIHEPSNKTKIVKAGFDLKTSFRNM